MTTNWDSALAGQVDEPVEAAQMFMAKGAWGSALPHFIRLFHFLRRALGGKPKGLYARLGHNNLIVVTPTRVMLWRMSFGRGAGAQVEELLAQWPREAVTASGRRMEIKTGGYGEDPAPVSRTRIVRLDLQSGGERIVIDLPSQGSNAVLKALKAKVTREN